MAGKFELFQDKKGEYRWRLRHQNGNVIADSGEGYTTKAGALNGIESVKKNVTGANIKELTPNEPPAKPAPAPVAAGSPSAPSPVQAEVKAEPVKPAPEVVKPVPAKTAAIDNRTLVLCVVILAVAWFVLCTGLIFALTGVR